MSDLALAVRALRSRNYRLFFGGQSISLIGTWMTRIATSWLVYRLTGSAALLGVVGLPISFRPFCWVCGWRVGGPVGPARTIVVTQILSMLQSFALLCLR